MKTSSLLCVTTKKKAELESQGFTVRVADYADVNAMVQAFDGIDRLLFVSVPVFDLQKNVVEAIRQSNIGFVAYTSLCHPEYSKFGLEINHRQTEELTADVLESVIGHKLMTAA